MKRFLNRHHAFAKLCFIKNAFRLLLLFFTTFTATTLCAKTYYVSVSGDNENTGSKTAPWQTIKYGTSKLRAGDTLFIREGVYHEIFNIISKKGYKDKPIIITGYQDERPVIDGNHLVSGLWESMINMKYSEYLFIRNIEVKNSRGTAIHLVKNSNHITFSDVWIHDTGYDAIKADSCNYLTIEDSKFWMTNIVNDKTSPWYEYFMWGGALEASGTVNTNGAAAHDIIIRRNEIFNNFGEGININGHVSGATIENNTFWNCWAPAIYTPNSRDIVISGNLVYNTNDTRFLREGNPGTGIGFLEEVPPTKPGPMENIKVINNIVIGCHSNFDFWNDELGGALKNVLIAYNTFVDAHSNSGRGNSIYVANANHENVRFENNIILQEDNSSDFGTSTSNGVTFSHNLWYPGKPPVNMRSDNDIYQDPLISRTGVLEPGELTAGYFKIEKNSPAIGAAKVLDEITTDFAGNSRGDKPAIGAFEFMPDTKTEELNYKKENKLIIYPNPSNGKCTIKANHNLFLKPGSHKLLIYNTNGILTDKLTSKTNEFVWNNSSIPSGTYIIKLVDSGTIINQKIQIIR